MSPGALALTVAAGMLGAVSLLARRPGPLHGFDAASAWRHRHPLADPSATSNVFVRGYLTISTGAARPLARAGIAPNVLTLWAVWLSAAVPLAAAAGRGWCVLAAALVVVSALGDGVDGAVASLTGRTSTAGAVLDALADRSADLLFVTALVAAGGRLPFAVAAGLALLVHEYTRALCPPGAPISVGERPSRIVAAVIGLIAVAVLGSRRTDAVFVANGSLLVMAGLTVLGWLQVLRWLFRRGR